MQCYSLTQLIRPTKPGPFFEHTWGQKPGLYAQSVAEAEAIMNLSSFEQLLATLNRAHEGWLHLARGGLKPVPPDMVDAEGMLKLHKIRSAFASGETLYLTKVERLSHPLMQLARAVELDIVAQGVRLREPVNAHVFLTPPHSQGFPLHRDEHASFVIQLDGCKEWTVYRPLPRLSDTYSERLRAGGVAPSSLKDAEKYTYQMQSGDVMYMPEWWPHEAQAVSSHSLHVTLRIFPLRWVDLALELCADHPALAGTVPRTMSNEPAAMFESLLGLMASPDFRRELPTLLEESTRRHSVPKSVLPDDGFRQILGLDFIELNTPLMRSAGATCHLFETGGEVCLEFPGGLIRGPASIKQVFAYVASVPHLRPKDLPMLADLNYDKLNVARMLVKDGLLRIVYSS
jgi:hypothetical protein